MRYPCLVPKKLCKTEISLTIEQEGISELGGPLEALSFSGLCNYQDKAKKILTADKQIVEISGCALLPGDICPEIAVVSAGEATVFGATRKIAEVRKARNPDGTVNYTEVLLI